jgi:two-component system chemotaxis sensor kinase CheA
MDVVRANIERIGGVIDIDSKPKQGVRLCIRVPLTLTIIPALTISAGGQVFAVPRSAIDEILRIGAMRIDRVGAAEIATVRGRRVPLVSLPAMLGIDGAVPREEQKIVLLKPAGGEVYALAVDAVHDHEELVVKPAAPAVMAAGLYAGTTLADDGSPILLLDPSGIAKRAGITLSEGELHQALRGTEDEAEAERETNLLLFRTLAGGRCAVPVMVVERIEDVPAEAIRFGAGKLRVAIGERILPLAGCDAAPAEGKLRILRLTDGRSEIAYGFAEVIDIRSVLLDLHAASVPGEVAGVALIDDVQVEVLDPHWLFAAQGEALPETGAQPVCALPEGDPWMEAILRPLVESLGYRVVAAREGVAADILILSEEGAGASPVKAGQVVRLRSHPDTEASDGSIYRYDRAALIGALSRGAAKGAGNG